MYAELRLSVPISGSVLVAMGAAFLTLVTFLMRRHVLRKKLRVSISQELNQAITLLEQSCDTLYLEEGKSNSKHTTYPDEILRSQIGQIGSLTKNEVRRLSEYYTQLQIFQDRLAADPKEGTSLSEHLNTTNSDKPTPCELLESAIKCVDAMNVYDVDRVDLEKYPGFSEENNED